MCQNNLNHEYVWFKEKKSDLAKMLGESSEIINDLAMPQFAENLKQLSDKVNNDSFKIQIVGTFKNGKSTFINALLGEDILPTQALPCTAVINEIKYGEVKRAVLHFRNPLPNKLLECIPDATMKYMQDNGMKDIPPMDIDYDEINKYVVIPTDGDPDEISLESPYKTVELFYPSPLLKEGVEIIDSPGLNEADERTNVTLEYLDKADAIIFLLDATKACAKDEMDMIEDILVAKGFDDMFFVVNRIDMIRRQERDDIKRFVEKKVDQFTTNPIYCVSALQAIEGKVNHNNDLYINSGMPVFELRLAEFLTKDKGRIKLVQPAKELNNILAKEALYKAIPSQRNQLSTSLDTLKKRYAIVQPQLVGLEDQKKQMYSQMLLRIERSQSDLRRTIISYFKELACNIPAWIHEYKPKTQVALASKNRLQKLANELVEFTTDKVKADFSAWNKDTLQLIIKEKATDIFDRSENDLNQIYAGIDDIYKQMSGNTIDVKGASGWERAVGAGLCLFVAAGAGADVMVNGFKTKNFIKNFAIDLGVGTGILLLGITNPVIGIAAVVALIARGLLTGGTASIENVKEQVSKAIVSSISNDAANKADEAVTKVGKSFIRIADNAVGAIDLEIDNVKSQLDTIMKEMEQGQTNIDHRNSIINECERKIQNLCEQLDNLVFELASGR